MASPQRAISPTSTASSSGDDGRGGTHLGVSGVSSSSGRSPFHATIAGTLGSIGSSTPEESLLASPGRRRNSSSSPAPPGSHGQPIAANQYQFMFHAFHAPTLSTTTTPRPASTPRAILSATAPAVPISPRDMAAAYAYEGVPEGLLATEGATLSASFSMAPSKADTAVATLSAIHVCSDPQNVLVIGDVLGRVELHEEVRLSGTTTPTVVSQRMALRHSHQAFVAELDCLKSVHIQEKVMCVRFLAPLRSPNAVAYLAANERNIKLFRLRADSNGSYGSRRATLPAKAFTGKHQYHIQTLSLCADGETFLSGDDLQVFWWHLDAADSTKAACIADIQPACVQDITEVITAASFHPKHGSLFLLATSSGECRIGDLRDPPSRVPRRFNTAVSMASDAIGIEFEHEEILSSFSDAAFVGDKHVVTRDYIGLKLWDLRQSTVPVAKSDVMGYVQPYLPSLYATDAIFDRFTLAVDNDTGTVVTGMYNSCVALWHPLKTPDSTQFYQGDPLPREENHKSGGEVTSKELCHEAEGAPITDDDGNVIEAKPRTLSEEDLSNKVINVAISDSGERIAFTVNENFFVFRKRPQLS